jgi:trigger factor
LPARSRRPQVTEEQVDQELNGLREQHARFDPLEGRALVAGDHALVDVLWRPAEGGRGGRDENALIEVGGETNSALREALSGMSPGETKQVNYTPEAAEGESPKPIHYTLTVKAVKHKLVPAADDDFAKDLGEFETLQELRADIRKRLEGAEQQRIDRELNRQLLSELCKRASFELPEALVERHMTARTEQAARTLAMQGVDPSKVGMDWKQYREAQRAEASEAAKGELLLDELARREGLEASDADVEAELARYARALRRPLEALRAQMEKNGELQGLRARLRDERSLDLIKADARLEFE